MIKIKSAELINKNYTIKIASREEIDIAVEWAAQEGWNPGLFDADSYYSCDPEGFLVGYLGDEAIASISVVKYGQTFGFLGFYIVKPEYRGQGYGFKIWQAGLEHLNGRNIGLDGVVEQQRNYKKSGFALAYRNIRYQLIPMGNRRSQQNSEIIELSVLPFKIIEAYDKPFFPDNRSAFLNAWINQKQSIALGIVKDEKLCGYGVIRPCRNGYKIGPLFADKPAYADELFQALLASVKIGQAVYLDIPELNQAALNLVKKHNMDIVFETARMYCQKQPELPLERLYGVTSFELG